MMDTDRIKGALWGLVVGDCLGSPIQFQEKDDHPLISEMEPCDIFEVPAGYWTDDSSMAFCVMDSYVRCMGYDREDVAKTFLRWYREGYLSSVKGRSFDVGNATSDAMHGVACGKYENGREESQGNGSIMRLVPSYLIQKRMVSNANIVHEVSDITHDSRAVRKTVDRMCRILDSHFDGVKTDEKSAYTCRDEVENSGWCVSTLDAALWAFNTTKTFEDGMLAAVNLGGDSDTIGAVYGQIAGAYYGFAAIPERWVNGVAHQDFVRPFIDAFVARLA